MCTAASHGVSIPFSVSSRAQRQCPARSSIESCTRRVPISGSLRLCCFDSSDAFIRMRPGGDLHLRTAHGVSCASIAHWLRRRDACSTSTATSERTVPRPRNPRAIRAHLGNQRSALRASLTLEQHLLLNQRSTAMAGAMRLSRVLAPTGATDTRPSPPTCLPLALAFTVEPIEPLRSTHRARERSAPRSLHALSSPPSSGVPS